jgi:hypothetical protein
MLRLAQQSGDIGFFPGWFMGRAVFLLGGKGASGRTGVDGDAFALRIDSYQVLIPLDLDLSSPTKTWGTE